MNPEQVTAFHRSRLAVIYIRQSTYQQVVHHQESQRRQRGLRQRATSLGWPPDKILEVDEDLGHSASRSSYRLGFHELVSQTALGKVGLILALEMHVHDDPVDTTPLLGVQRGRGAHQEVRHICLQQGVVRTTRLDVRRRRARER